jgi:hypothetical protein
MSCADSVSRASLLLLFSVQMGNQLRPIGLGERMKPRDDVLGPAMRIDLATLLVCYPTFAVR